MNEKYIIKIGKSYYSDKMDAKIGNKNMATAYTTEGVAYAKIQQLIKRYKGLEFSIIKIIEEEIKIKF